MKLVGLISGGKDSLYNLLQCIAAGHEIVAVANVEPDTTDELDSYMYQSVGHQLVSSIAGALCLPIFKQKTKGMAICKEKTYIETSQDEVEDLMLLLTNVKKSIHIDGVAVGAIASDYQRTRVESVCTRLGLKCFAYLWRRNQVELLQEMIDADLDAIIIKVACIGLNVNHLGMSLKEIQPVLLELHRKYGMNVCGEGGEYETTTLDCPLFHRSITVTDSEKVTLSKDPFAPVGLLNVKKVAFDLKCVRKNGHGVLLNDKIHFIRSTIKDPYVYVQDCVDEISEIIFPQSLTTLTSNQDIIFPFQSEEEVDITSTMQLGEYWKQNLRKPQSSMKCPNTKSQFVIHPVMNLNISSGWCFIGNVAGKTISDAMQLAKNHLHRFKYFFDEVVYVNLFVNNLAEFSKINEKYSQFMPEIKPPARACVETVLPPEIGVILIVVAHKTASKSKMVLSGTNITDRETMHVQSISHWAPANIGPYSQCTAVSGIYYVAGQIPLIPGTMEILNKPILHQCRLTLRHILRILEATKGNLNFSNVFQATCYVTSEEFTSDVASLWPYITKVTHTAVAVVVVTKLPKNAQLEWEVMACCFSKPTENEKILTLDEFQLVMKRCWYKELTSAVVCKFSYLRKNCRRAGAGKNFKFGNGISEALWRCIEFLKKDSKSCGSPLCMLKLFYKYNDNAVSDILNEIVPSFVESKVVATPIPVVACEDPDIFLTVTGICV